MGFPSHYLPNSALMLTPAANASNLDLPLDPKNTPGLKTVLHTDPSKGSLPKGGQLLMSIAVDIYWYWRDTHNTAIVHPFSERRAPFQSFVNIVHPSNIPGAVLTPFRLGIAYCWILNDVLAADPWPAYVIAETTEYPTGTRLGIVSIEHTGASLLAPYDKEMERIFWGNKTFNSIMQQSGSNRGRAMALRVPQNIERRWFECLSKFLFYIIKNPQDSLVTDKFPAPTTHRTSFECHPRLADKLFLTVYVDAMSPSRRFTWRLLAEGLLVFGAGVSMGYDWDFVAFVQDGEAVLAALQIWIGGEEGVPGSGGTATAG